ncbi:hypothetical protein HID58_013507 [Brassica napus]|uniref:Uncharacterized protein n=1 Tax=Brassica napus TaxID=3708 RepID=A0ABQ8E442_BRANA|nr:hypothetical protein HID58_013507 [Brassica napus]
MTDVVRPVSFIGEVVAKLVLGVPQRFRWMNFLMSKEALRHSRVWDEIPFFAILSSSFSCCLSSGNVARLSVSTIYDELVRAASSVYGTSFVPPAGTKAPPTRISPMAVHQRLLTELFFLRNHVRGMAFHRDQLVLRTRATARWGLMKEWLEKKVDH